MMNSTYLAVKMPVGSHVVNITSATDRRRQTGDYRQTEAKRSYWEQWSSHHFNSPSTPGIGQLRRVCNKVAQIRITLPPASRWLHWAGHTSTPFCFVIRQFLGFFPGQVHLSESELPFDDVYPVLPCLSWFSLVTSQFPMCCPWLSCSRVVHSQDVAVQAIWAFFL